jgi:RNA-binding protein YhbY
VLSSTLKFDKFKERKKELAPQLADQNRSQLVTRVGNVVVLYRPKRVEETQSLCESPAATLIAPSAPSLQV